VYDIEEISIADTDRLYRYKEQGLHAAAFGLKGFEHPWIQVSHKWREGERVLDVGAGYSLLSHHLHETYGCESWNIDDFGLESEEAFWTRGRDVQAHIAKYPSVEFVRERLGNPASSSLSDSSFDVIFSASALEHVPGALAPRVWNHMDRLLKPGGVMLHAIDIGFASNYSLPRLLAHFAARRFHALAPAALRDPVERMRSKEFAFAPGHGASMVCAASLLDWLAPVLPEKLSNGLASGSPRGYARMALKALNVNPNLGSPDLGVVNFVLNPRVVTTSYEEGCRLHLDEDAGITSHRRTGALLLKLRKRQLAPVQG
jgi:2-polyprenyl-3-methyl-5-hydroxy-6-metoxy-1,4-benzoquinol methylase